MLAARLAEAACVTVTGQQASKCADISRAEDEDEAARFVLPLAIIAAYLKMKLLGRESIRRRNSSKCKRGAVARPPRRCAIRARAAKRRECAIMSKQSKPAVVE